MAVFVVVSTTNNPSILEENIKRVINDKNSLKLPNSSWLIEYDGTTLDLANSIEARGNEAGAAIVFLISNYSGRATPNVWEWLRARPDARSV